MNFSENNWKKKKIKNKINKYKVKCKTITLAFLRQQVNLALDSFVRILNDICGTEIFQDFIFLDLVFL